MFFFLFFFFMSCYNSNLTNDEKYNLSREIIKSGNTRAYIKYSSNEENNGILGNLSYSFIMADKYNNSQACYDVYYEIIKLNNEGEFDENKIEMLPKIHKQLVVYYLKKGDSLGNVSCKNVLAKVDYK